MNVYILSNPALEPVPSDTKAPWLDKNSSKWRLTHDWTVYLDTDSWLVPKGYVTDLSSVPRIMWRFFPPGYGPARRGALLHDFFYSHGYKWVTKEYADEALRSMMIHDGASKLTAWLFHRAVRLNFNGGGW